MVLHEPATDDPHPAAGAENAFAQCGIDPPHRFDPFAVPWTVRHERSFHRENPVLSANLGIFLREPRAGRTKTRLIPALGEAGAASLYGAFVEDTLNLALRSSARHCRLWIDGTGPTSTASSPLRSTLRARRDDGWLSESPQVDGDLGARLAHAFDDAASLGATPLLMIGTDSPDLPLHHLQEALRALSTGAELVLGAAADGGVWCIGLARPVEGFFDDLPWSAADTGDALRTRGDALGLVRAEVSAWYDCDTPADLGSLARRLRTEPGRAKMTWQWLAQAGRVPVEG